MDEAPRAVWLGRIAAVMEARGDRDEAVRLYGEASAALTGSSGVGRGEGGCGVGVPGVGLGVVAGGGGGNGDGLFPYSARAHHLASMIERSYRRHFKR